MNTLAFTLFENKNINFFLCFCFVFQHYVYFALKLRDGRRVCHREIITNIFPHPDFVCALVRWAFYRKRRREEKGEITEDYALKSDGFFFYCVKCCCIIRKYFKDKTISTYITALGIFILAN